jgi:hypothetical protein
LRRFQPLPLFNEQHEVGLQRHQQPGAIRAVDVSFNERLHFARLNLDFPTNAGDVALKLSEFLVHGCTG